MKKAVISYNFGNYDKVHPVQWKTTDWDYFLFTDKNSEKKIDGWQIVVLPEDFFHSAHPKRRANQIKYSPFKTCKDKLLDEYDLVVVIDANIIVQGDMDDFVDTYCMSTMDGVFITHPSLDNAYEDIDLCAQLGKDDKEALVKTHNHFKEI